MSTHVPIVIAHRGASGEAPENTLAAFRLAVAQGCDAIELDIHLSADGQIVVCHDDSIGRTTTGKGVIREMTVKQLKQADAGVKFGGRFAGERIPLLEEVFDAVPQEIMLNIEIKGGFDRRVEPALLELLERKKRLDNVVVSSFNHKSLRWLKQLEPRVKIGLLYATDFVNHRRIAEAMDVDVYSLHPEYRLIRREDIADAVAHGLKVFPYTINGEMEMRQAVHDGASGIITDYPGKLKQLLRQ